MATVSRITTSFPEYKSHTAVGSAPISPPLSPSSLLARPPTPGRGPLSSHPATPVNGGSYFPSSHSYKSSASSKASSEFTSSKSTQQRRDSMLHLSPSPASQKCQTPPPQQLRRRDSAGIKRLLSFATLRKSFMGLSGTDNVDSATSLPLSRAPTTGHEELYTINPYPSDTHRPSSPSISSSTNNSSLNVPMVIHTYIPAPQPRTVPQLRKRKSASWFQTARRKSGLFTMDSDFTNLENVTEAPARPKSAMGFERIMSPAPVLPDVGSLRGGRLTDGAFAGEDIFGPRR